MQGRVNRGRLLLVALVALAGCGGAAVPDPAAPAPPGEVPQAAAESSAGGGSAAESSPPDPAAPELSAHSGPAAGAPPAEPITAADPPAAVAPAPEPEPAAAAAPPPAPIVPGDGELDIGRGEIARAGGRVNGGIFQRQVERKRGAMLTCYNLALGADPELAGDLVVVLAIDTQGMVGAEVEEDDEALAAAGVTSCVVGKLRQVSFSDTPPSSELRVRVPLHFEP